MSVTYGFYNSLNGDRKYDAADISRIFDGLITDGIFRGYGDAFEVTADGTNRLVCIGTGRAWFNHTWTHNDTAEYVEISSVSSSLVKRIDTIVIDVNPITRINSIRVISGIESSIPNKPALTDGKNGNSYQYPLCDIFIDGSSSVISQSNITNRRGLEADGTPFVTSAVQSVSVDDLVRQWKDSFDDWLESIKGILDEETAGNLAGRMLTVESSISIILSHHRNIFRGKNLGTSVTVDQLAAIRNGTFEDLYVGDYWEINVNGRNVKFRIADFDYWVNTGYPNPVTNHHVVIVPEEYIINETVEVTVDNLSGGLMSGSSNGTGLESSKEATSLWDMLKIIFGVDNILTRRDFPSTKFEPSTNGNPTVSYGMGENGFVGCMFSLLNEPMVFGGYVHSAPGDNRITVSHHQLALFRLAPRFINVRYDYWLRDIVDSTHFAMVSVLGIPSKGTVGPNNSRAYLRPVFAIC